MVMENESYDSTFGPNAPDTYLKRLATDPEAVLLSNYYAIGHNSLDNYIAMISGQAPNPLTQADCPYFVDVVENEELMGEARLKIKDNLSGFFGPPSDEEEQQATADQVLGIGCVYPRKTLTISDQLEGKPNSMTLANQHAQQRRWRAYMEDMAAPCQHPALGARDGTHSGLSHKYKGKYAVRHNPFVYFHSLIDKDPHYEKSSCEENDVPLGDVDGRTPGLVQDLKGGGKVFPSLVFISPNLCNDGHNNCADNHDGFAQVRQISVFLQLWMPKIRQSDVYKDAMIIITFDEAEVSTKWDLETLMKNKQAAKSCCREQPGPLADQPGLFGPGGGRVGAILLSPFVQSGENSNEFNHYSLLKSLEDLYGLEHLGFAKPKDLKTLQECGVFKSE
jgi:hypothetical protein